MEAVRTSETLVDNHFTRRYIPEDNSEHHTRRCENLKSHITELLHPCMAPFFRSGRRFINLFLLAICVSDCSLQQQMKRSPCVSRFTGRPSHLTVLLTRTYVLTGKKDAGWRADSVQQATEAHFLTRAEPSKISFICTGHFTADCILSTYPWQC
jgi:hypothetical protein